MDTKVVRTPQGGLRVPAFLTRTGVFVYHRADGSPVREYRPAEEVFHADALASLADAPVTDLHPSRPVTADTYRQVAAGHVAGAPRADEDKVAATLVIQDKVLITAIERRDRTEVSCGYVCDVDDTPGVSPAGESYDRVQRNIRYNHVAIVPRGRAGSEVALRLDSDDNIADDTDSQEQHVIKIDGIDYPLSTDAERQAAVQAFARFQARVDALVAERDSAKGRADAADAALVAAKAAAAPEAIEAAVTARLALRADAAKVLGPDVDLSGKSPREIREAVVAKALPAIKLDGASDAYLEGLYAAALVQGAPREDSVSAVRKVVESAPSPESKNDAASARERMIKRSQEAHLAPLAVTK